MPAPSRARQPLPQGQRPSRSGTALSAGLRPIPTGPQPRRRDVHTRARGVPMRLVLVGTLVLATVAVGTWYLLGRGGSDSTTADYVSVEKRFVTAAWAVHFTPLVVQQFRQLRDFNTALDAQAVVMEQSISDFDRIARTEEGDAASIARESVTTAERALRAVSDFRDAIVTTNDLADAQDALDRIDSAARALDAKVKQWKQL